MDDKAHTRSEKRIIARWAETGGLLRVPERVELPRDVFNPSVLSVRLVPRGRRILSNAIPVNGLSASISDRSEDAACKALPFWVVRPRQPLLRRLS